MKYFKLYYSNDTTDKIEALSIKDAAEQGTAIALSKRILLIAIIQV